MFHGYDHLVGKWILGHGAARLHYRGKLLGWEQANGCTRLFVHPSICVFNWDKQATASSLNERRRDSTPECPDVWIGEHFTRCGVQPKGWPEA